MDIEKLRDYIANGLRMANLSIKRNEHDLLIAAKEEDFDQISILNMDRVSHDAVQYYIETLLTNFPELKTTIEADQSGEV